MNRRIFFPMILALGLLIQDCTHIKAGKTMVITMGNSDHFLDAAHNAYARGDYNSAITHFKLALISRPDNDLIAYNLACCYALEGDAGRAAHFISRAINKGFWDVDRIFKDKDFDSVRGEPEFQELVQSIQACQEGNSEEESA